MTYKERTGIVVGRDPQAYSVPTFRSFDAARRERCRVDAFFRARRYTIQALAEARAHTTRSPENANQ